MATKRVELDEAREQLAELIALAEQGTEVVLTDGSKPLARLVPINGAPKKRIAGLNAGAIWMSDDFDDPLPDEFWLGEDETAP